MADVSGRQWKMINQLAAELAQRNVDDNLVQSAAAYMKANPQADLQDWLYRLVRLGNLFGSSNQTDRYRYELWAACDRLKPQPQSGSEWAIVLAWTARLQRYYNENLNLARKISNVAGIRLPERPSPYQPPTPQMEKVEDIEIPVVQEEVSQKAKDFYAFLQDKWTEDEKKNSI